MRLSEEEANRFLAQLRPALVARSAKLRPKFGDLSFRSNDLDVSQVLIEVCDYLKMGGKLRPFKKNNFPVNTRDDLQRYALRRLKTVFLNRQKAAEREDIYFARRPEDFVDGASPAPHPTEHGIFTREIISRIFDGTENDPVARKLLVHWLTSHLRPGTENRDPCDNIENAKDLGETVKDIKNARRRLETLKNQILSDKVSSKPKKGPSR